MDRNQGRSDNQAVYLSQYRSYDTADEGDVAGPAPDPGYLEIYTGKYPPLPCFQYY